MHRYRVFISSTIDDLLVEREAVEQELVSLGFFDITRVEKLPATDRPSEQVCLEEVRRSDGLVLILSQKYGFIPPENNPERLSVTHIEYREAARLGLRVYVYIRRVDNREPELQSFVDEVSEYHRGYFRCTWSSLDQLREEVKRSAMGWLSSALRSGQIDPGRCVLTEKLGCFSVDASLTELEAPGAAQWLSEFLELLEIDCRSHLLPVPTLEEASPSPFGLVVERRSRDGSWRCVLILQPVGDDTLETDPPPIPPIPVELLLEGEEVVVPASAAIALVEFGAGNIRAAIDTLLEAAQRRTLKHGNRESLLCAAALISALGYGQLSEKVAREIMALKHPESTTINAGGLSIVAAQQQYQYSGASQALRDSENLYIELMQVGFARSEGKPEFLYNLARQVAQHSPKHGRSLFEALLSVDSSYEERWYFHRDLGLLECGLGNYSKATDRYDRACHLKPDDSELWRYAGDALYYDGFWAEALIRYEKAVAIEQVENYYLGPKIAYARA